MFRHRIRFSLKKKITILIIFIILSLIVLTSSFSYIELTRISRLLYTRMAENLSNTVSVMVDSSEVKELRDKVISIYDTIPKEQRVSVSDRGSQAYNDYTENFESITKSDAFISTQKTLCSLQDSNKLKSVYIICFYEDSLLYLVDASNENKPGSFNKLETIKSGSFRNPERGVLPEISYSKDAGWVVSTGSPIFDDGILIGFSVTELQMNVIMAQRDNFLVASLLALSMLAVFAIIITVLFINKIIIYPIKELSLTSERYLSSNSSGNFQYEFSKMQIHTGDELEMLSNSMKQMEQNINNHISKLLETSQALATTQQQAKELDKAANVDALTKVRNKRAYNIEISKIDRDLQESSVNFGVVMIDLNFLKKINDTYGHDCGDISIRTLCRVICEVFAHSPVFRIGGDEFVVILKDSDFYNRNILLQKFELEVEELQKCEEPWKKVSAAVGVAVYEPTTDAGYEDVFKRADKLMYKNKKKMKAVREE